MVFKEEVIKCIETIEIKSQIRIFNEKGKLEKYIGLIPRSVSKYRKIYLSP